MKVNIKKELENSRNKSIDQAEENVQEVKLLLDGRASKEREILKHAGLDHNILRVETEQGINLDRKKFESEYGDVMFTKDEIQKMCHKYYLKFLPTKYFKGHVDPQLGAKILRFFEQHPELSMAHESSNNLFIMAPPNVFNLENKVFDGKMKKLDPVVFLRVTNRAQEEFFIMIHKWGNDFTIVRRILGLINQNHWTAFGFHAVCLFGLLTSLLTLLHGEPCLKVMFWSTVLSVALPWLRWMFNSESDMWKGDFDFWKHRYSKEGWDSFFSGKLKYQKIQEDNRYR